MSNMQFVILCGCILFSAALISGGIYKILAGVLELCRRAEAVQKSLAELEIVGLKRLHIVVDRLEDIAQK
jgi:hypothetical protein